MPTSQNLIMGTAAILFVLFSQSATARTAALPGTKSVERGRYIVKITSCNNCHTPGWAQTGGKVEEKLWLTGDPLGYRGPWGTTYASNLRLYVQALTEDEWVKTLHVAEYRPPMPWNSLHAMSRNDLRAVYQFIKYLGPAGDPAPAYLPPDQEPKGPFVLFPSPPK